MQIGRRQTLLLSEGIRLSRNHPVRRTMPSIGRDGGEDYGRATYSSNFLRRRPRNTARPPANIVRPDMAEAGSISGARTGSCPPRPQESNQKLSHLFEPPAEATPAMVNNTIAKLNFLTTGKLLKQ